MIRLEQAAIVEAKQLDQFAMAVCTRICFIQTRLWELFGNAPIHDAPTAREEAPVTDQAALDNLVSSMRKSGHVLERRLRGPGGKHLEADIAYDATMRKDEKLECALLICTSHSTCRI